MEHVTQEQVFTREKVIYPLFLLGQVVATRGAMSIGDVFLLNRCLNRHVRGDWGHVCEEDAKTNDEGSVAKNKKGGAPLCFSEQIINVSF
jgi:hypothetical protein